MDQTMIATLAAISGMFFAKAVKKTKESKKNQSK